MSSLLHEVISKCSDTDNIHHRLWSEHGGKALLTLLSGAGYPVEMQHRSLVLFTQLVAPSLGVFQGSINNFKSSWHSFMTDEGSPLELSWDWGTSGGRPIIRYSIEPVGLLAGTLLDPTNSFAGPAFEDKLVQVLPEIRLEWFHYFKDFFSGEEAMKAEFSKDTQDHNSSIFYAFDLSDSGTTAKVYFFPKYRARSHGKSNLEVMLQAIVGAPYISDEILNALSMFQEFIGDADSLALEYDMLATDLIDPLKSRLKIYFRCRHTTFNSVENIMTLGGRISDSNMKRGFEKLHRLWDSLFDQDASPDQPLNYVDHRTAGILYNVEFKFDDGSPIVKVYLPVRHYSRSDGATIGALSEYFQSEQINGYVSAYTTAMNVLYNPNMLRTRSGVQTYVGCSIKCNGMLRIVSYFKLLQDVLDS
ncbi:tryptophan dimethylallyltransferase-domain-containing protein [Rostrohypoxylon terebratum]|nr:tryptophan dimethylallyltransferase-domain-containing protein [Rostrohypoxylon terebratum]